jgi:serine/threonine-protein kinase
LKTAPPPRIDTAVTGTLIPLDTLERVSQQLAAHIGPVAEVLVKRAAKRSASADELIATVAREIEDESDRAKFLRAVRT